MTCRTKNTRVSTNRLAAHDKCGHYTISPIASPCMQTTIVTILTVHGASLTLIPVTDIKINKRQDQEIGTTSGETGLPKASRPDRPGSWPDLSGRTPGLSGQTTPPRCITTCMQYMTTLFVHVYASQLNSLLVQYSIIKVRCNSK